MTSPESYTTAEAAEINTALTDSLDLYLTSEVANSGAFNKLKEVVDEFKGTPEEAKDYLTTASEDYRAKHNMFTNPVLADLARQYGYQITPSKTGNSRKFYVHNALSVVTGEVGHLATLMAMPSTYRSAVSVILKALKADVFDVTAGKTALSKAVKDKVKSISLPTIPSNDQLILETEEALKIVKANTAELFSRGASLRQETYTLMGEVRSNVAQFSPIS